jgi:hypothetical protein
MKPTARNVTRAFRAASVEDRLAGQSWYATAREVAATLDPDNPARAAAVIAVLSPRLSWRKNIEAAADAYAGRPVRTLASNAAKAAAILAGTEPDDVVKGPKVRAFWRVISDPSDPRSVVVDRHAVAVAVGRTVTDAEIGRLLGRRGGLDTVTLAYQRAARILSREMGVPLTPSAVQATCWLYWRRERAAALHGTGTERL